jgi:squalene-hopene/tetraprenyl-beta-curcumene cyclase
MTSPPPMERLEAAYRTALARLLAERTPEGHWVGELSASALSTATAVSALSLVRKTAHGRDSIDGLIRGGLAWLAANQNEDGGWGDTIRSVSNISTTMLGRAAIHLAGATGQYSETLARADGYMRERFGTTPEEQAEAVRARYGKDRTFAVPILTTCALAGMVKWDEVPSLPFELACFPQSWFRFLRLQVVSYALPALIAIGQCVYRHRPPWNPLSWLIRRLAIRRSLRVLETIQPSNGGFLEATPLTSFVTLSLASIGLADHPVARKGADFIVQSVRPDGSWPIDTNLSTWVTTLSINALAAVGELDRIDRPALRDWLLKQQYQERHPYTGADPGAWAWSALPGGVPDADDTPGALLALNHLCLEDQTATEAAERGCEWLLGLQNRDGGWPTFCRGWGHLPFDRSGSDLTAHVVRACAAWHKDFSDGILYYTARDGRVSGVPWHENPARARLFRQLQDSFPAGFAYLARTQRPDGSWLPLWFGNQHAPDDENPTYGTARVLAAYRDLDRMNTDPAQKGIRWLLSNQNADGGWGGGKGTPSSIEETALAVEVLLSAGPDATVAVNKGLQWLVHEVETGGLDHPIPIGFYFAKLWYFEKLYPIIFTVAALGHARRTLSGRLTEAQSPTPT